MVSRTYTGATTISAGTLRLGAAGDATNTPLGTTAAGTRVAATGAALDLNGFTLGTAEALTLNGTGVGNRGALTNSSATGATYNGLLTLGSASTVAGTGNITLSNSGTITGPGFGLTLDGTATGSSIASIIGTGGGTLTKTGTGTWTLSGANTYSGTTAINGGILKVTADNNLGTPPNVPTTNIIFGGGTLQLGFNPNPNRNIRINAGGGTIETTVPSVRTKASAVITNPGDTSYDGLAGTVLNKEGAGQLTIEGAAGDGFLSVHVKNGTLDFESSQTLDALVIDDCAIVTLSDLLSPPLSPQSLVGGGEEPVPFGSPALEPLAAGSVEGVPEPGSITLLALGMTSLIARRYRS